MTSKVSILRPCVLIQTWVKKRYAIVSSHDNFAPEFSRQESKDIQPRACTPDNNLALNKVKQT